MKRNKKNMQIIEDVCSCGESISVEIGCKNRAARTDGKRPFYPDQKLSDVLGSRKYSVDFISVFRCRKCGKPVDETVPAAAFENARGEFVLSAFPGPVDRLHGVIYRDSENEGTES